jgi:aerobic-type carbon monoxide dehydrogenase small subunit (CoxS/CutS family)
MSPITITVNGQKFTVEVDPDMPLLWVLRDTLGLTGTKYSCGIGVCGSCTVHHAGEPIHSCTTPISAIQGEITTIEGLSSDGSHPLQRSWIKEHVSQCGYCQPGQLMTAAALLAHNPKPTEEAVNQAMSSVLCRCGTYLRIRRAILRAAEEGGAS